MRRLGQSDIEEMARKMRRKAKASVGRPPRENIDIEDIPRARRRAVVSEESEGAAIARNQKSALAQGPHPFRRAQWTDEAGKPRCLLCGAQERVDARDDTLRCDGIDAAKAETAPTIKETGEHDAGHHAEGADEALARSAGEGTVMDGTDADPLGAGAGHPDTEGRSDEATARSPDERSEAQVSPVITKYTDGLMHAHLGASAHFHEVRKDAGETGVTTDTTGIELPVQHAHPVHDGVLKDGSSLEATLVGRDDADGMPAPAEPPTASGNAQTAWIEPRVAKRGNRPVFIGTPLPKGSEMVVVPTDKADETMAESAPDARVAKTIRDLLPLLDPQEVVKDYRILKAESTPVAQRYTLGLVYAPGDPTSADAHGDYSTAEELERAAWRFARKGLAASGIQHKSGTQGRGDVVESYIYRGPDWVIGDQIVKAGSWLMGCIWDEPTWAAIQGGKYTGLSLQGFAARVPDTA